MYKFGDKVIYKGRKAIVVDNETNDSGTIVIMYYMNEWVGTETIMRNSEGKYIECIQKSELVKGWNEQTEEEKDKLKELLKEKYQIREIENKNRW